MNKNSTTTKKSTAKKAQPSKTNRADVKERRLAEQQARIVYAFVNSSAPEFLTESIHDMLISKAEQLGLSYPTFSPDETPTESKLMYKELFLAVGVYE